MNDLMATVNSVFSRSRPAATRESLTGVSSSPYVTSPGAYTDAGGMKIEAPFVTGMRNGYPVPPSAPAPQQDPAPSGLDAIFGKEAINPLRRLGLPGFEAGGVVGYASGGSKFIEAAADIVAKAREAAKAVRPSQRAYVYHNLNADKIEPQIDRFGAIVAPSLAISKPSANPVDFGNVTLIGRQHLAIPGEGHPVFRADAYTPRMPLIFSNPEGVEGTGLKEYINRSRYDATPVPPTIENVLEHMRSRGIIGGEGEAGLGMIKALAHPPFRSFDELRKARMGMPESNDEYQEAWDDLTGRAIAHGGVLSKFADEKNDYSGDAFIRGAAEYQRRGMDGLRSIYPRIPDDKEALFKNFIYDVKQTPASYYEAKPMRAVSFDEFGGALMPIGGHQSERAAEALAKAGIPQESIMFYNPAKYGHRYQMLREQFGDLGFAEGGSVQRAIDISRRGFADGGEPGDRAHEFVQDQLYDEPRLSPLVEQYAGPMARFASRENADRPMPTAHEFVQHQLNKQEPQLPQFDRAARDTMRDYAVDAIHGAGYFTPLAPALAAYDALHGAASGDPLEIGLSILGAPGRYGKAAALAANVMAPQEAQAESPVTMAAVNLAKKFGRSTVAHPYRKAFPGIYGDPRAIVAEAESRVAPESPALKQLFGVTRQDLYDIGANRPGNMEPSIAMKAGARGTPSAENLMVPRNERRLIDVLSEAGKMPGLRTGMDPWYVMDPLYNRMERLLGPDEARRRYDILNHSIGTMSPGSPVTTEVNRGLAAYYLHNQGRYKDFLDYGGNPGAATAIPRGRNMSFAEEFPDLLGHAYHSTSQAPILGKYLETGNHGMQSPKVPLYIQSSGVPQTGFQTRLPVPDAHFTRAVGMADTRKGANDFGVSMKMPEYQQVGPWFRDKVAAPAGLEAVPAQARLWGAMSGQTGVDTAIGSPKLEMIANEIMRISRKHGISPERARDMVLQGELFNRGGSVVKLARDVISRKRDAA